MMLHTKYNKEIQILVTREPKRKAGNDTVECKSLVRKINLALLQFIIALGPTLFLELQASRQGDNVCNKKKN